MIEITLRTPAPIKFDFSIRGEIYKAFVGLLEELGPADAGDGRAKVDVENVIGEGIQSFTYSTDPEGSDDIVIMAEDNAKICLSTLPIAFVESIFIRLAILAEEYLAKTPSAMPLAKIKRTSQFDSSKVLDCQVFGTQDDRLSEYAAIEKFVSYAYNFDSVGTERGRVPQLLLEADFVTDRDHIVDKYVGKTEKGMLPEYALVDLYGELDFGNRKAFLDWILEKYQRPDWCFRL